MHNLIFRNRSLIIQTITCLYILLFVYTAFSKLLDFENFRVQLAQSPLLSAYAGFLAPFVILGEIVISGLLCYKPYRLFGLYAAFEFMVAFSVYIYLLLNFSDFIPCSCGGVIENLDWTEHLVFNLVFSAIALLAIVLLEKEKFSKMKTVLARAFFGALFVLLLIVVLFISSEHIIKKENNFIRRFIKYPITEDLALDLGVNSFYFAGVDDNHIYLGNTTAPLVLTCIDTSFTTRTSMKVKIQNSSLPFRFLQFSVSAPFYYVYDGTVPVIFKGLLGDTTTKTILYKDCYFSQLQVIDSLNFAFRTRSSKTKSLVLGKLFLEHNPNISINYDLITKQVDGMFDADGQLLFDDKTGELLYIYHYRNQILVIDQDLHLIHRFNTIDTISHAQVQVQSLKNGLYKLGAPPLKVNNISYLHGQVLFNVSNLMGKYESRKMWKEAVIIDLYLTGKKEYSGSFYVHNRGKNKLTRMLATDTHLFVLSGTEIVRYRFAQSVTRHFKTGEAENLE